MPKTTGSTLAERMAGIAWDELSKTFQDALVATKGLGSGTSGLTHCASFKIARRIFNLSAQRRVACTRMRCALSRYELP